MLTTDEQTQFVHLLDKDAALRDAVETLSGQPLEKMKFGAKVTAITTFLEGGRSAAAVAGAARARRDLLNLASEARGDVALSDKLEMSQSENDMLKEKLVEAERATKVARDQATKAAADVAATKAYFEARAVNSGETR